MNEKKAFVSAGINWIGYIPNHWGIKSLKFAANLVIDRADRAPPESRYVGLEHIEGKVGRFACITEGMQTSADSTVNQFKKGDVLFGKLRPYLAKAVVADTDGFCSSEILVYRANEINAEFLKHAMLLDGFIQEVNASTYGSKMPRADSTFIGRMPIPCPPLAEQLAIAAYLDTETTRIDGLIAEKNKLKELLLELRSATIADAVLGRRNTSNDEDSKKKNTGTSAGMKIVSNRSWVEKIPETWSVKKIKHLVRFAGGGTPSKANDDFWNGNIPWVSPKDMKAFKLSDSQDHITDTALRESACSLVPAGSVLIVVRSGILQHTVPVAINEAPVCLNQDMKALIPDEGINSDYLAYLIRGLNSQLRDEWVKQGATVESIEYDLMANTQIPVPPLAEQQTIASHLDTESARVDVLMAHVDSELELLKELRSSTITDAVLGRIDIRGVKVH